MKKRSLYRFISAIALCIGLNSAIRASSQLIECRTDQGDQIKRAKYVKIGQMLLSTISSLPNELAHLILQLDGTYDTSVQNAPAAERPQKQPIQITLPRFKEPYRPAQTDAEMALLQAAYNGDIGALRNALRAGADIRCTNPPIDWKNPATYMPFPKLFRKREHYHKQGRTGNSALHLAALNGQVDVISELLDNGAEIDACNDHGMQPLWFATVQDKPRAVQALLNAGANVNAVNKDGTPPLMHASWRGLINIMTILLRYRADTELRNISGSTPLLHAANQGHADAVRVLLQAGADKTATVQNTQRSTDFVGSNALLVSCRHKPLVNLLLEAGFSANTTDIEGLSPLYFTVSEKDIQSTLLLLQNGAILPQKTRNGITPIHVAFFNRTNNEVSVEILAILIRMLSPTSEQTRDEHGNTIVHHLAIGQCPIDHELLQYILRENPAISLNERNQDGYTPPHLASYFGKIKTCALLIENGANPNLTTPSGGTVFSLTGKGTNDELSAMAQWLNYPTALRG